MIYSPVFLKDGNLLIFLSLAFLSKTEAGAIIIGYTAAPGLGLYNVEFTGEALELAREQRYIPGSIAGKRVAVLSGPEFSKRMAAKTA